MITKSFAKIGGIGSIIQAIMFIVVVIAFALTPEDQLSQGMDRFAVSYAANPIPLTIMCLAFIILGLLGFIVVVPATAALFEEENNGWVTLGKNIALLSTAVIAVYYIWFIITTPERVLLYNTGDAVTKAIIAVNDPQVPFNWVSWFLLGGMGLWVAVIAAQVFMKGIFPRGFGIACIIKTCGLWISLAGIVLGEMSIIKIGAIIGSLIGGPIYHIWIGIFLLHKAK